MTKKYHMYRVIILLPEDKIYTILKKTLVAKELRGHVLQAALFL